MKHSDELRLAHGIRIRIVPFTNSSIHHLRSHHTTPRTFINIELKLKKQQRPTNVYHAEKNLSKSINAATGRHIPQRRIKTVVAHIPSDAVKLLKRDEIQRKHPGTPK